MIGTVPRDAGGVAERKNLPIMHSERLLELLDASLDCCGLAKCAEYAKRLDLCPPPGWHVVRASHRAGAQARCVVVNPQKSAGCLGSMSGVHQ